jgi:3-hydroxyacyl-CoA dehydrogenase/enoyl-CoA hydratase/3-hydroxybutyryl-CoA epimerase
MNTTMGLSLSVEDGVAIIVYDQVNSPINTLNSRIAPEFEQLFDRITADTAITSAVVMSGKRDSWIAGADIEELAALRAPLHGEELSRRGQQVLARLESLGKPVVAAIHGAALGGGLEMALACTHRIATDHPKTVLALPEVQLGLLPGAGGTQRLPRRIGLQAALDMILTGKNIRPKKALQLGLIDELVHPSILRDVAVRRARDLARGVRPPGRAHAKSASAKLLEDNAVGRALVFRQARESVLKKTKGHYPAPLAIIDVIQRGYSDSIERGYIEEARRFGELAVSNVSRQLVYIFFATTALKKDTGLPDGVIAEPLPVKKLGILGAGFMGAGIASVAVQHDVIVRMKDASNDRVAKGFGAVRTVLSERAKRRSITRQQMDTMLSLLGLTIDYSGFANADLVIEAVFEDLEVKHQVLREVGEAAPRAIFASNTSTIPIRDIAKGSATPERVIGMHFFSPVHKMPLLEIIVTPETDAETTATAVAFGRQLGKTVIVVRDGPGFYVNRILAPYINESGKLLDEGVGIDAVDRALATFGFPVGPITLLDEVGLDIAGKSGRIMSEKFGARMQPSVTLQRVIESGRLGRKAKRGFYKYDDAGKRRGVDEDVYDLTPARGERREMSETDILDRTVLPMLNEAVACLEEGIIRSPRDGDIGAVFGIGFPPFLGGPFRYIDTVGAPEVVRRLDALAAQYPGRFTVTSRLRAMAENDERFHPDGSSAHDNANDFPR